MAKAGKILTCFILIASAGCSTKYSEVAPDTELRVYVINEVSSTPIKGATVYLYDNQNSFDQTIASTSLPTGFVGSFQTGDSGKVVIPKLKTNIQYFVYAYFQDTSIVKGTYITLDNSAGVYVLKNNLPQSSISTITIPVAASDGFIVFWTRPTNSSALPINAFIGNNNVGTVTQSNASGVAFQSGNVTARARAGSNPVEGTSATNCIWDGSIAVTPGGINYFPLADCSIGTVGFYTDNSNASVLPVQIIMNANDNIGNLSAISATIPSTCSAPNVLFASRVPGTYTYQATSTAGNCVWNGTFTITDGGCNLIYLPKCN